MVYCAEVWAGDYDRGQVELFGESEEVDVVGERDADAAYAFDYYDVGIFADVFVDRGDVFEVDLIFFAFFADDRSGWYLVGYRVDD